MTERTLAEVLDDAVSRYAERAVLRVGEATWTYAELDVLVRRAMTVLAERGVGPGSRVGLSAANGPEFIAVVFAVARLGAASVMISTAWREREVTHALTVTEPTHLVYDGSGAVELDAMAGGRPLIAVGEITAAAPSADRSQARLDDLALMVFSSGTTGLPKAVCHSHRSMHHAIEHWVASLGLTAHDRLQIATPPFHILGLLNFLVVVSVGASMRLHRRFDLDAVLASIEADRVTIEMAVAPIALAMANHPELERYDLSSLRYILWGATPVTPSVAETVTRRTGVGFVAGYGASELPVLAVNSVAHPERRRLDAVGRPPEGVEIRVVDLDSGEVLAAGGVGELQGRSASRMVGYLPPEADAEAFDGEWYRTGDVGWIDEDGDVHITDRVKEMVKVKGLQVAPAELEAVLLSHPEVVDCAVFGVPDPRTDETPVAAVVTVPDATVSAQELMDLVALSLAGYKRLSAVQFVDQVPRLPSGKVLRRELKAAWITE